jgi:hypothetical protein
MTTDTQDASTNTTDAGGTQTADQTTATADTTQATQTGDASKGTTTAEAAIEYKFDAPEGVELDQGDLAKFTDIAKELKLPPDAAKKLVDIAAQREVARAEAFAKQVEDWGTQVKADPELGKPENLATAKKTIDTFGTPELRDLLNSSGMGNHPEVIRMALKIGKAISEDTFVAGRTGAAPTPRSHAEVLYGTPPTK